MVIRKQHKNLLRYLFVVLVCSCLVASCAAINKDKLQEGLQISAHVPPDEKVLRVGVSTDAAPLIYKHGQNIVGLEAELAREYAKFLGKTVQFIEVKWEDQIPALLDDWTDIIMSGMSITKTREYRIAFSDPYFRTGQMALIRKADSMRYPDKGYYGIWAQANLLRIGVVKGTTGEFYVQKRFSSADKIVAFLTAKEGADALRNKKIDMLVYDAPMVFVLGAEYESDLEPISTLLTEEYLAWGIRKNDVELIKAANSFIETLRKDGRLYKIVNRWIPFKD